MTNARQTPAGLYRVVGRAEHKCISYGRLQRYPVKRIDPGREPLTPSVERAKPQDDAIATMKVGHVVDYVQPVAAAILTLVAVALSVGTVKISEASKRRLSVGEVLEKI
jgi:hypothetical protein